MRDQIEELKRKEKMIQGNLLGLTGPKETVNLSPTRSLLRIDPEPSDELKGDVLKSLVSSEIWDKISIRVVDVAAVSLAVRNGVLAPGIVAQATVTTAARSPHFRAVRHDNTEDKAKEKPRKVIKRKRV